MLQVKKIGGEFSVADPIYSAQFYADQFRPEVAGLANGGFVVTWGVDFFTRDEGTITSEDYSVKAQVFAEDGTKAGGAIQVNTQNSGIQSGQKITGLENGGFVVTWIDGDLPANGGSFSSIKAQVFAADGAKVGNEFVANEQTAGSHYDAKVTGLSDGGFVVAWTDDTGKLTDQVGASMKVQVFDASATRVGGEFSVSTQVASGFFGQTITRLANGGFVLAWRDNIPPGGFDGNEIYAQVFRADGTNAGSAFLVNTQTAGGQIAPTITGLANGGFVVSWVGPRDIFAQVYGADGKKVGAEFQVNTETAHDQGGPTITGLVDGGFVVTWTDGSGTLGDDDLTSIKAQVFGADGTKAGSEFLVNTQTAYEQQNSTVTALASGGFVVSWWDLGSAASIKAQIYSVEVVAPVIDSDGGRDKAAVSIAENASAVTTVHAAGAVTYTISGGADSALFQIDAATGALSFKAAPNFEAPADAGGNNVYNVTVTASEGSMSDSQSIAVKVLNVVEDIVGTNDADRLTGTQGADVIRGLAGNDLLIGKAGDDRLIGGTGNDTYVVDTPGDKVVELVGEGTDTVKTALARYALGENLENLAFTNSADHVGVGNAANNWVIGGGGNDWLDGRDGADTLAGGAGNDTLFGGLGKDVLKGGEGADKFVFNTALDAKLNLDKVTDFASGADKFVLDKTVFAAFTATGAISEGAFWAGAGVSAAHDADDRLIYNTTTGALIYDPDGTGKGAAVQIALLAGNPDLAFSDFQIVA